MSSRLRRLSLLAEHMARRIRDFRTARGELDTQPTRVLPKSVELKHFKEKWDGRVINVTTTLVPIKSQNPRAPTKKIIPVHSLDNR